MEAIISSARLAGTDVIYLSILAAAVVWYAVVFCQGVPWQDRNQPHVAGKVYCLSLSLSHIPRNILGTGILTQSRRCERLRYMWPAGTQHEDGQVMSRYCEIVSLQSNCVRCLGGNSTTSEPSEFCIVQSLCVSPAIWKSCSAYSWVNPGRGPLLRISRAPMPNSDPAQCRRGQIAFSSASGKHANSCKALPMLHNLPSSNPIVLYNLNLQL